jgi:hypothetical protein
MLNPERRGFIQHFSAFRIQHSEFPMDAFKIAIKLFAAQDGFEPSAFVPVFHRWIQQAVLPGHLLIDVADYAHVYHGPGTVLVTSEANLYTDRAQGRLGLLYSRKLPMEGTFAVRLRQALAQTLKAAALLEAEPSLGGRLRFRTDELQVRLNDRLLAPNTAVTFGQVQSDLQALAETVYPGETATIERGPVSQGVFEATIKSSQNKPVSQFAGLLL